jgi:hypothetical protein
MVAGLLNVPWTLIGLLVAAISLPSGVRLHHKPFVLIFTIKCFWWKGRRKARATTSGYVVLLSPEADGKDLMHELVHVQQYVREPFVHPLLYVYEVYKHGYRRNKYEQEAYERSKSRYLP